TGHGALAAFRRQNAREGDAVGVKGTPPLAGAKDQFEARLAFQREQCVRLRTGAAPAGDDAARQGEQIERIRGRRHGSPQGSLELEYKRVHDFRLGLQTMRRTSRVERRATAYGSA